MVSFLYRSKTNPLTKSIDPGSPTHYCVPGPLKPPRAQNTKKKRILPGGDDIVAHTTLTHTYKSRLAADLYSSPAPRPQPPAQRNKERKGRGEMKKEEKKTKKRKKKFFEIGKRKKSRCEEFLCVRTPPFAPPHTIILRAMGG